MLSTTLIALLAASGVHAAPSTRVATNDSAGVAGYPSDAEDSEGAGTESAETASRAVLIAPITSTSGFLVSGSSQGRVELDGNADGDVLCDTADKCPFHAAVNATDTDLDGRGDACECTDQTGDGRNTVADLVAINVAIFNPAGATPLCDGNNDGVCNVGDIVAANVEIFSPTSTSTCARQPVPGP